MGAQAGYTLLTGLFIGLGGVLGYISFIVEAIPRAVLAPILIFVALDIMSQAFLACPARHAAAVAFSFLPSVARLVQIKYSDPAAVPLDRLETLLNQAGKELPGTLVTFALGNGFILTAMLWGAFLAEMIDRRLRVCAFYLGVLALFSFFGLVHSPLPDGRMFLPWSLAQPLQKTIAQQFTAAYLVLAALIFGLSFSKESREAPAAHHS
jgi:AGZA family xanthine/uracil permease-like MFS transporter